MKRGERKGERRDRREEREGEREEKREKEEREESPLSTFLTYQLLTHYNQLYDLTVTQEVEPRSTTSRHLTKVGCSAATIMVTVVPWGPAHIFILLRSLPALSTVETSKTHQCSY